MNPLLHNLKDLGFNENEIKVYLSLTKLGEARVTEIAGKANLPRTTTFSILERLSKEGLLSEHTYHGTTYYWVESPEVIKSIYENKARLAGGLADILSDLYRSDAIFPFAKSFDSKSSIKTFTEKILVTLPKQSIIYTIDAPHMGNYKKIFSDDYYDLLLETKRDRKIITKTLVPYGTFKLIEPRKLERQEIEIKELPKGINFEASLWLINDNVVVFSGKPPFAVSIRHQIIFNSYKSIYGYLWQISKPLN